MTLNPALFSSNITLGSNCTVLSPRADTAVAHNKEQDFRPLPTSMTADSSYLFPDTFSGVPSETGPVHLSVLKQKSQDARFTTKKTTSSTEEHETSGGVYPPAAPQRSGGGYFGNRRSLGQSETLGFAPPDANDSPTQNSEYRELLLAQRRIEFNLDELIAGQTYIGRMVADLAVGLSGNFEGITGMPSRADDDMQIGLTATEREERGMSPISRQSSPMGGERVMDSFRSIGGGGILARASTQEFNSANDFVAPSLPLRWPTRLRRRPVPYNAERLTGDELGVTDPDLPHWERMLSMNSEIQFDITGLRRRFGCGVLEPHSIRRIWFDLIGMIMLCYDLTVTPFVLAWQVPYEGTLLILAWVTAFFWIADIGINFFTGYYESGAVVRSLPQIAARYLRTWFFPDVCLALVDLLSMAMVSFEHPASSSNANLKVLRFAKAGRSLRIINLLRTTRWISSMEKAAEVASHEGLNVMFRIGMVLWGTLWFTHVLACLWYAIGSQADTDTGARWVGDRMNLPEFPDMVFQDTSRLYQYMTSLHWVAAQLSLGGNDIRCVNSTERAFNIAVIIFALFCGSTLVSLLSAVMVAYQMSMNEQRSKLKTLRTYFRENEVDRKLARRLHHLVACRLRERDRLKEDKVEALSILSTSLRSELRLCIFNRHLVSHPFLRLWGWICPPTLRKLADDAVEQLFLRSQDHLFAAGEQSVKTYMLVDGIMVYTQDRSSSPVEGEPTSVEQGSWLSQASLWSEWIHTGTTEADTTCSVMAIHAEPVALVCVTHRVIHRLTFEYARHFCARLVTSKPPLADWPSDLHVPFTDFPDITMSMDEDVREVIGRTALEKLQKKGHRLRTRDVAKRMKKLKDEVSTGVSVVTLSNHNEVVRVVSIIAVCIQDYGGRIFTQVGKPNPVKHGHEKSMTTTSSLEPDPAFGLRGVTMVCQLPGMKQESPDMQVDLRNLLETKLAPFAERVRVMSTERFTTERDAKDYALRTRYLRNVITMNLEEEVPVPVCELDLPDGSETMGGRDSGDRCMGPDNQALLQDLQKLNLHVIDDDGQQSLFVWLEPDQLARLSSADGEEVLWEWSRTVTITTVPDHSFI